MFFVAEDPNCGLVERNGAGFEVHYRGDAEAAADLLAALIGAGVRVGAFARRKEGLEELFLKVGAQELS